jgi:uncharacterized protein (DUF58 family)
VTTLTPRAWGLALLGSLGIALGALLGWAELVAVGAGMLSLPLLVLLAVRSPRAVSWQDVTVPARVVRGDPSTLVVAVTARGSTRWLSASGSGAADGHRAVGSGGNLSWPVDTSRRGLIAAGPTRLEFADPFGLRYRLLATREATSVLVIPRVTPLPAMRPDSFAADGMHGERAGSEQFQSLREYSVGDPVKLIHWRSTARTGTVMVRRMVDTTVPALLVALDVDPLSYDTPTALFSDLDTSAFERAVDLAASWAWSNTTPGQRVLLTTTRPDSPVIEVAAHSRPRAIDWLALVEPGPAGCAAPTRIGALLRKHGAGRVVLITGRSAPADRWARAWTRTASARLVRA